MTGRRPARNQRRIDRPVVLRRPAALARRAGPGLAVLAAALLAVLLYLPAAHDAFVRDDHDLIEQNQALLTHGGLVPLATTDFWLAGGTPGGMWRPLVSLSYALDARRAGVRPRTFHLGNILLHGLVTGLVTLVALQVGCGPWAAAAAGAWFAVAPVHVESVAWVSGRTDVLCALFAVACLALDRRARRARRDRGGVARVLAAASLALALLCKESAIAWVAVLAVAAWVEAAPGQRSAKRLAAWLAPYVAVTVVYALAHARVTPAVHPSVWQTAATQWSRRLGAAQVLPLAAAYLLPGVTHSADRIAPAPGSAADPAFWGALALTLAMLTAGGMLVRRGSRLAVPFAAFAAPLLLTAALAAWTSYLTVAERNVYLPSAGAAWGLGLALEWVGLRAPATAPRWAAAAAAAALVALGGVEAARALPDWRDDRALYASMVRAQPADAEARIGLANELLRAGRTAEAEAQLDQAARLEPRHPALYVARAWAAATRGDWAGELAESRRALALNAARADAWVHEISALVRLDRLDEADSLLAVRWARYPHTPMLQALRGRVLLLRGHADEALPLLESATRWIQDDAALYAALGDARSRAGAVGEAGDAFERATVLAPDSYDAWLKLALSRASTGDRAASRAALARAAALPGASDGRADHLRQALEARWGAGP